MATLQHGDIADRLINSLKSLQKGEWFDVMQTYNDYPMMRVAMSNGKEKSGNKHSYRIGVGETVADGHTGLYEDFDLDRPNVMTEASDPWVNLRQGFAIDTRELDPQSDPEALVDDMEVQRNNMFVNIADNFELKAMNVPAVSDPLLPRGIPYFIPWSSVTTGGFHAVLPAGHTTISDIDPAVQTKHQSWSDTYANATRDDLGRKIGKAIRNIKWAPPQHVKGEQKINHAILMDQTTIEENEIAAANQNDQVGPDTQPMFNRSLVARLAPQWVPTLDSAAAASSNPVYIVNWAYLFPVFRKGWKFPEFPPQEQSKQRTVIGTEVHAVYTWSCQIRRRQAVIAKAAPFGETAG